MSSPRRSSSFRTSLTTTIRDILKTSFRTSLVVVKIIIPVSVITRLLTQWGLIDYLGIALGPVMETVGLPGSMGLVWATSIVTNLYAGMVVFYSLAPLESLTVSQVTVLATMMLVAHALPIELRIAQKAGPRFRIMVVLRLGGALSLGWILNQIYTRGGFLQSSASIIWQSDQKSLSWTEWALGEARTIGVIFVIITALICLLRTMDTLRVTTILTRLLGPPLRLLGMSANAAPITIIGMTMGIGYGGGLIITEARSGRLSKKDVFFALSFMGLMHSIVEDTLLMIVMGGHVSGVLWGRLLFAVVVIFLLVRLVNTIPDHIFSRFFYRDRPVEINSGDASA